MNWIHQEPSIQEIQLPRERGTVHSLSKALAPRASCGTKGHFLLRRTCYLTLTTVAVTQPAISRARQRRSRWDRDHPDGAFPVQHVLLCLQALPIGVKFFLQLSSQILLVSGTPFPRLGWLLEDIEVADNILGFSLV